MPPQRLPLMRGLAVLATAALPLTLVASPSSASGGTVNVVGYSIVSKAYTALEKAFGETLPGQGVTFTNSFGASTTQAQDVIAGLPADLVNFSYEPDMQLLVNARLVSKEWASTPTAKLEHGMVTDSVVAIVVRPGNPLGITGWNSLTQSGVKIVTPDPISSGSAQWNLLGAYESQIAQGERPSAADTFLNSLVANVVAEPSSGSKALTTFIAGTGNVLLAYESDALSAFVAGQKIQIVQPAQNLLIENPAALTTSGSQNTAAVEFYRFIFSTAGQEIWLKQQFRPTLPSLAALSSQTYYTPVSLTRISSLGGWTTVESTFFGTNGIVTKAENAHGYTT